MCKLFDGEEALKGSFTLALTSTTEVASEFFLIDKKMYSCISNLK